MDFSLTSISIQQINVFLKVVEFDGFAKASKHLLMTQSAVSKSIAKLEHELGLTLFQRSTREVNLTDSGRVLYDEWYPLVTAIHTSYAKALAIQNEKAQMLNIGLLNTARPERYLKNFKEHFYEKFPEIDVEFDSEYMGTLISRLADGEYDAIFIPDFERFSIDELGLNWKWAACSHASALVCSSHRLADRKYLYFEEILDEKFSTLNKKQPSNYIKDLKERFLPYNSTPNVTYDFKNAYNIMFYLKPNPALLLVDEFFDYPENYDSVRIPILDQVNGIICAWNPKKETAQLKNFLSFFNASPKDVLK